MVGIKKTLKALLFAIAPQSAVALFSARARAHSHRVVESWGCLEINQQLIAKFGEVVQSGHFSGLVLSPMTRREHLGPFLLGTYESELDNAWEVILRGRYSQIIDVGAKFGYYAIGLARLFPETPVVAFDTDAWARKASREMAVANGVPNVVVRGFCSTPWLLTELRESAFIISDCEGYEGELLASVPIPQLSSATMLIELHEEMRPGVTEQIRARFEASHDILAVGQGRRESTQDLGFLTEKQRHLATHEVRGAQSWILCTPKAGRNPL